MHGQLFRLIETKASGKGAQCTKLLSDPHRCLRNNKVPPIYKTDLSPPNPYSVLNPNAANTRYRATWNRAR